MKNFIQEGDLIEVVTPAAGYTSGGLYFQGALFGIAALTSVSTEYNQLKTSGVFELTKAASQAWAIGDPIYWDIANASASTDPSVGPRIGSAANVVANGVSDTLGYVKLASQVRTGGIYHIRKRFTIAQVNAGATLLPATPGVRYRMIDSAMIAIGGAAGGATTVDILATLSTVRKLVAAAIAGLGQSVVARAGATNITVLADGASFTANDVNTAVTVGVTGSALTTATHVDVLFTYAMDSAA